MSTIRTALNDALKHSIKTRDSQVTSTLRLILAALKDRDIAARSKGNEESFSDDDILLLLQTMVKQRRESITLYEQGGRLELAEQEKAEIDVIERFLPQQLDEAAISDAIHKIITELGATGLKEMGTVMAELRTRYAGQMDFGKAAGLVKSNLSRPQ